jgi:hypothetical protein
VIGKILRVEDVDQDTVAQMYKLFLQQFEEISLQDFTRDLRQKNWLLLLSLDDGVLAGFSSIHVYQATVAGRSMLVAFSGDTVVDASTWRDSALSYYWMGAIDYLRRKHQADRIYWFLLVSGYRTYRFLPVYSQSFYPRFDQQTPADVQRVMDTLALQRYGEHYDAAAGVVRLEVPAILREPFRGIPVHRLKDPHIAFFAERNPGHLSGDELVCFAEISEDKLTRLGRRMWLRGRKLFSDAP